jgi:hypothetical protein
MLQKDESGAASLALRVWAVARDMGVASAFDTDVCVVASGGTVGASTFIPSPTGLSTLVGLANGSIWVWISRGERWGVVDPLQMEVRELIKLCEFQVLALGDSDSDSLVIVDDSVVDRSWRRGKESHDVVAVATEFSFSMGKDKQRGIDEGVESHDPLSVGLNCSGWFGWPSHNFKSFANCMRFFVFMADWIHSGYDVVEVNCLTTEDVTPLGIGKLWVRFSAIE